MTHNRRQLTPEAARLLTLSTEPWLSCEDCFELMDVFVEKILAAPDSREMQAFRVHLRGCAACAEEAESLLGLVAEQDGRDPGEILRSLHT